MSAPTNPAGKKYNFKVKIVQTDLTHPNYLYQAFGAMGGGESPIMYQNSRYISKLFYINNVSGGILAKDKVEDMPERYKRFINTENPSAAEMAGSFIREMAELANREEIGQNVFYSRLSDSAETSEPAIAENFDLAKEFKNLIAEIFPESDPSEFEAVYSLLQGGERAYGEAGEPDDFDDFDGDDFGGIADYELYAGEEVKDILRLNNYYNSEEYKMSRAEYNFDVCGEITVADGGSLILQYDESELTGYGGSYIQLMFDPQKRDALTIRRNGYYDSWLFLERGKTIQVSDADNYSGAALAANTRELFNSVTAAGGEIRVVYITETNGFPTEMIYHTINAEPAAD